jgi:hypothetical protein
MPVQEVGGRARLCLAPYGADHLLPADRPILQHKKYGQDHPLLDWPKVQGGISAPGLEWPEHLKPHAWIAHATFPATVRNPQVA